MRANAIEAAEQCGILTIPQIEPEMKLDLVASDWPSDRLLIFCDEDAEAVDPMATLRAAPPLQSIAVLIGPEGGFDPSEREMLRRIPGVAILSLGPRILRADTAAVAALALAQAARGDWR
jgi:16S rRNA (uracil1498-N3)-methyltransferase